MQTLTARVNPDKAIEDKNPEYLLSLILDIAEEMLTCGAEVNRVEDTLLRLCTSYGYKKINVFTITEFIFVSFLVPDGQIITQTRRIYTYSNHLSHLEDLNGLSRYICANQPGVKELHDKLEALNQGKTNTHPIWKAFPIIIGSSALTTLVAFFSVIYRTYFINKRFIIPFRKRVLGNICFTALIKTSPGLPSKSSPILVVFKPPG